MPIEVNENMVLLYHCFDDLNDRKVNFHKVAQKYGITTAAARGRFNRVKSKIEAHLAKKDSTAATTPTKKPTLLPARSCSKKRKCQDRHESSDEEEEDLGMDDVDAEEVPVAPSTSRRTRGKRIDFKAIDSDDPSSKDITASYDSSDEFELGSESDGTEEEMAGDEKITLNYRGDSGGRKTKGLQALVKGRQLTPKKATSKSNCGSVKATPNLDTVRTCGIVSLDNEKVNGAPPDSVHDAKQSTVALADANDEVIATDAQSGLCL